MSEPEGCQCDVCKAEQQANMVAEAVKQEAKAVKEGPKTQKAKGIMIGLRRLLSEHGHLNEFMFPTHYLVKSEASLDKWQGQNINFFARPCPQFPRHGFVESRPVTSVAQLRNLLQEVLKEDPNGEILLGPSFKEVTHNAIYTDFGSLSIGPGNDGATGGKGALQLAVAPMTLSTAIKDASGINAQDATYFEIIYAPNSVGGFPYPNLVQMRGGPVINAAEKDYIPEKVVVQKIVAPVDDLLIWAKQVAEFEPGTVVWGDGHTLASHAAVHCIIHKVPFITSQKPEIGRELAPSSNAQQKKLLRANFKKGMSAGFKSLKFSTSHMKDGLTFSLSVLHNWAYLRNTDHAAEYLGAAVAILEKICASLVLGEYRHSKDSENSSLSRDAIYDNAMTASNMTHIMSMKVAFESFHGKYWKSGFGGDPWAMCAYYSIKLWNAMSKVYNKTTKAIGDNEIASLIEIFNGMINLSHNNGWWFNKIASQNILDMAAKTPGLAATHAARYFLETIEASKSVNYFKALKEIKLKDPFFVDRSKGACAMYITKDRMNWVVFKTQSNFKRSTKYENTPKQLEVIKTKMKKATKGRIYLMPTKNGTFKLGNRVFNPPCKLEMSK